MSISRTTVFRVHAAYPIPGPAWLPAGPGLDLLLVNEVRAVQFQDVGVTVHVAPQEIPTNMKATFDSTRQAPPGGQGSTTSTGPAELAAGALALPPRPEPVPGSSASWPFPGLLFCSLLFSPGYSLLPQGFLLSGSFGF